MNITTSKRTVATATERAASFQAFRSQVLYPLGMHALMLLGVFIIVFPLLYAIILSTQSSEEYYQVGNLVPGASAAHNYQTAWQNADMGRLISNTLVVSLGVAFGKIILSITAAFALIFFRVRGGMLILGLIMLTHLLPLPVRIVPTYDLLTNLGWINTFWGLTIPFFASATGVLLFQQFFRTVPTDLADAARVDGAGPLRYLFGILIPISRTNIGALFLIEFVYMWNQYLWPLLVANTPDTRQIQIGIKQLVPTDAVVPWGILMAAAITAIIPPLVVLLLLQKSLMAGLTADQD
ncbi:MAG: ABC transporter permease subunit [Anaerolineae bacterium]|nr:ABC transporter permease subunit [Anaerolineae bacterium]